MLILNCATTTLRQHSIHPNIATWMCACVQQRRAAMKTAMMLKRKMMNLILKFLGKRKLLKRRVSPHSWQHLMQHSTRTVYTVGARCLASECVYFCSSLIKGFWHFQYLVNSPKCRMPNAACCVRGTTYAEHSEACATVRMGELERSAFCDVFAVAFAYESRHIRDVHRFSTHWRHTHQPFCVCTERIAFYFFNNLNETFSAAGSTRKKIVNKNHVPDLRK